MTIGDDAVRNSGDSREFGRGFFRKKLLWVVPQSQSQSHCRSDKTPNHSLKATQSVDKPVNGKDVPVESEFVPAVVVAAAKTTVNKDEPSVQMCAFPMPPHKPPKRTGFSRKNFHASPAPLALPEPPAKEPARLKVSPVDEASSASFVAEPSSKLGEPPVAVAHTAKRKTFQEILQCNHVRVLHDPAEETTPGPPLGRDPLWRAPLLSSDLPPCLGHSQRSPKAPMPTSPHGCSSPKLISPKFRKSPRSDGVDNSKRFQRHCADRIRQNLELMGAQRGELRELQDSMQSLLKPTKQSAYRTCG